jgi:hypothetical protein
MTKTQKILDRRISEIFSRRCSGIAIDIMDIGKVFEAGRRAAREDALGIVWP